MTFDFPRQLSERARRAVREFATKASPANAAKRLILIPALLTAAGLAMAQIAGTIQTTDLVSVSSDGFAGDNDSQRPAISADGRYVAFDSVAENFSTFFDIDFRHDIFVHDRQTGATEHVSVNSAGEPANDLSIHPAISADGRYVAFISLATNLIPDDNFFPNPETYIHDRQTGTTEVVNIDNTGVKGNFSAYLTTMSPDGRFVAFLYDGDDLVAGDTNGLEDVYVRDRLNGTTERVNINSTGEQADDISRGGALSADGRFVAFVSKATNLVSGDTNGVLDVFVRDRLNGATERVNVNNAGEQALHTPNSDVLPSVWTYAKISADGRFVAFESLASNLDPADTNEEPDVFVHDRQTGTTELISVNNSGARAGGTRPFISGDGRYVVFASDGNIVPGVTEGVFVRDRTLGVTELVSVDESGTPITTGPFDTRMPVSADGQFIAFGSNSTQLVPAINGLSPYHIFVRNRGSQDGETPSVSAGGPYIVNEGGSTTLTAIGNDPNGGTLTYAWDFDSDGTFETPGQSPTFSAIGLDGPTVFSVRVQVTNTAGLTAISSAVISANNVDPTVSAGGPYVVDEGGFVIVSAIGDDAAPADAAALKYAWDLDNNGTFERSGQSIAFTPFGIDGPTVVSIRVQVSDNDGGVAVDTASVTVNNAAPTVDTGGPYVVNEGSAVTLTATGSDPAPADTLTYVWDLDNDGVFETPGQSATFSAAGIDGPASRTVRVQVSDDDGGVTVASTTVTVDNVAPTANAGGPYVVNEGGSVTVSATGSDIALADVATLTYAWDLDNNGSFETPGQSAVFSAASLDGPTTASVSVQVTDDDGGMTVASATVTVDNVGPQLGPITTRVGPTPIKITFFASAPFTDPAAADTHRSSWGWVEAVTAGTISDGTVTGSHAYANAGVRTIGVSVSDDDGDYDHSAFTYAVTYDPAKAVATGGGSIASPAGAYAADPTVSGIAHLGFVSEVPDGATTPVRAVAFHLDDAGFELVSRFQEALVIGPSRATITGTGSAGIANRSTHNFLLTVIDGQSSGGDPGRFRIKIWNDAGVVYDSQPGAADDADPTTALQSGSIIVQKTGN